MKLFRQIYRICPMCGKLAGWNSWFSKYYCTNCGNLFDGNLFDDE